MRHIKWFSLALGVLTIAALACGGGGATPTTVPPTSVPPTPRPTQVRPTATPEAEAGPVSLEVVNDSGEDIWAIYISPSDSSQWGDNWLGGDRLPDGESYTFTDIEPGTYDLRADDGFNNAIDAEMGVEIDGDTTWTVTGDDGGGGDGSASVEVVNNSSVDVWYVYISPSTSNEWGDDWLGSEVVSAGERYTITGIDPGTYDLKAEDADHNTLATEMGVEIDGAITWTLSDIGGGGGEEISQWATGAAASSEYSDTGWSTQQATGAPDTPGCGDYASAWAASGSDTVEWIELEYDVPVWPVAVNILQTYNPNQVVKVELRDGFGNYHTVYTGRAVDESGRCPFNFHVPVDDADYQAVAVRVTIDQSVLQDWNEIDAVELVGIAERPGFDEP